MGCRGTRPKHTRHSRIDFRPPPILERVGWGVLVLNARGILTTKVDAFLRACRSSLVHSAIALLPFAVVANAQSTVSAETGSVSNGNTIDEASKRNTDGSLPTPNDSSQVPAKPGNIVGTILDQTGSVAPGAVVRLTSEDKSYSHEVVSGDTGQFSFSNVPPGPFKIAVKGEGFGEQGFSGEVAPGQTYLVPPIVLAIATVVTDVRVAVDPVEVATEEVKEQEHQRVFGFIPNFYVTYHPDAAPLTTKLKFHLAWKSSTDPVTIAGAAFLAGLEQAGDQYSEFGQGMQGYGKRLGAGYADIVASTFLSGAVFPSLFKQDPRYYYQGTGSTRSRILHAASNSVICKGDNGRWQMNYSNIAGIFGGAALSSTFYPTKNPGTFILSSGLIRMGESSLTGFVQEFIVRKLSKQAKRQTGERQDSTAEVMMPSDSSSKRP
jgi:Carboxypeptidase regulatory-like domain